MHSVLETVYDPYAPNNTIYYTTQAVFDLPTPIQVSQPQHTVRDVALQLGVARNSTLLVTVTPSGYASFRCYRGCAWNSSAACFRINCHGLRIEQFYKQRCALHAIPCHPHFSAFAMQNMIRQGLVHAAMGVDLRMRAESPHQSTLCEACLYGQTVLH